MLVTPFSQQTLSEKFVFLAVFLFPVLLLSVKHAGSTIFFFLFLFSIPVFIKAIKNEVFSREEKLVFYSCVLIFLMAIFTAWLGGMDEDAWKKMDGFLNLLLVVPLYFLFRDKLKNEKIIWIGLVVAVLLSGALAIYEKYFGGLYFGSGGRARAATHPILFADITLTMCFMVILAATTLKKWNIKIALFIGLVMLCGLTAVVLSQSRGAWVVVPVLMMMMFWQLRSSTSRRSLVVGLAGSLVIVIAAYVIPATGLQQRIQSTLANVQKYEQGTHKGTSIGTRFEMWKAAVIIYSDNAVHGVGWGNYKEAAADLIQKGVVNKSAGSWNHPHNQYLSMMVNGGSMMLFAFIVFTLVPLVLFLRLFKTDDAEVKAYAISGMILIVSYMGYGLSEAILERSLPTIFYAFMLALCFALANRAKRHYSLAPQHRTKKLSVTVISFNEADRIESCLASVSGWADEIILFDNGSTDGTIEIAKKYTDKVFVTDWPGFGKQKQRALEQAQFEWVLSIDADESLTPELRTEIDRVLSSESEEIAYRIPWAVTIYNKRLDFGRSGRAPLRLFKRDGARFSDAAVHEKIILPEGKVGLLDERLQHYTHRDLKHAMDKFNKYAWLWATERATKGKKTSMPTACIHGFWMFIVVYILRLGFLDGFRGLLMAVHYGLYTFNKYAALWTLRLREKKS